MTPQQRDRFEADGCLVLDGVLDQAAATRYAALLDPLLAGADGQRPGTRGVLRREPALAGVLDEPRVAAILRVLGVDGRRPIRSLAFDKSPDANWAVPWHQDPTIAVAERVDLPGYGPWRVREGVPHCQPPREVLESIVVLRLHLDPCARDAGPLEVIPGSHRGGVLDDAGIERVGTAGPTVHCVTGVGGAVLMRPLTVHSSGRSTSSARRRVLHLEFSQRPCPHGLRWADA